MASSSPAPPSCLPPALPPSFPSLSSYSSLLSISTLALSCVSSLSLHGGVGARHGDGAGGPPPHLHVFSSRSSLKVEPEVFKAWATSEGVSALWLLLEYNLQGYENGIQCADNARITDCARIDANDPWVWSKVCVHNMAKLSREASTFRQVMESLFHHFANTNSWSSKNGLALCSWKTQATAECLAATMKGYYNATAKLYHDLCEATESYFAIHLATGSPTTKPTRTPYVDGLYISIQPLIV